MNDEVEVTLPGVMEILRVIRRRLYARLEECNIVDSDIEGSVAEWNRAFGKGSGAYEMLSCFQDAEEDVFSMLLGSMTPKEFIATTPELFSENQASPPCNES